MLPFLANCEGVVVVVSAESIHEADALTSLNDAKVSIVTGGSSRVESVQNGLAQVPDDASHILVHDGARPLVSQALITRVIDSLASGSKAVVPAIEVRDTLRSVSGESVDRSQFLMVQTPQGFSAPEFRGAHASLGTKAVTDDAMVMEVAGESVTTVDGETDNIKITYPTDLVVAEAIYESRKY